MIKHQAKIRGGESHSNNVLEYDFLSKHAESGRGYLSTDFKHEFQIQFMVNSLYQRLCLYWKTSATNASYTALFLNYKIN
jgi:hypothetical protein